MVNTQKGAAMPPPYKHTIQGGKIVEIKADEHGLARLADGTVVATFVRVANQWVPQKAKAFSAPKPQVSILGASVVSLMDEASRGSLVAVYGRNKGGVKEVLAQEVYLDPSGDYKRKDGKPAATLDLEGQRFGLGRNPTVFRSQSQLQDYIASLQKRMIDLPA